MGVSCWSQDTKNPCRKFSSQGSGFRVVGPKFQDPECQGPVSQSCGVPGPMY